MAEVHLRKQLALVKTWLLDTGPLVAYLEAADSFHERVSRVLGSFDGELVTTGAVVTEAMYFLKKSRNGPERLIDFLDKVDVQITECCQPDFLRRAVELMRKYADAPMDFADATLVVVANELHLHQVCTIDRRVFSTFRTSSGKRFEIVLESADV